MSVLVRVFAEVLSLYRIGLLQTGRCAACEKFESSKYTTTKMKCAFFSAELSKILAEIVKYYDKSIDCCYVFSDQIKSNSV